MSVASFAVIAVFQSTLSMRRATGVPPFDERLAVISIHALHEESDPSHNLRPLHVYLFQSTLSMRRATQISPAAMQAIGISIHALHEESDSIRSSRPTFDRFQSTLSMRRATPHRRYRAEYHAISIHALHEESDGRHGIQHALDGIFQSTLSMRRATRVPFPVFHRSTFQSTLSMRRATGDEIGVRDVFRISIHALHEESDDHPLCGVAVSSNFNPRSP